MNKKQAFIIATLLVLIVCAGILATKVNSPLYVNGDLTGTSTLSLNKDKTSKSNSDFFTEARLSRDQTNDKVYQTLKTLIDDPNTPKESKTTAANKYTSITLNNQNQSKIENALKAKDYEDSVCTINDDKVSIIIKSKEALTDKQTKQIKDIVVGITKIKDVEIESKQ